MHQVQSETAAASQCHSAVRVQQTFVTAAEKKVLLWLAQGIPPRIHSDHLTALGALGMLLAGASYALARYTPYGLLLACFFLAVNWLGDSLDGTLARFRRRQRPRYGYYVDHVIDSFGATALLAGIGLSGYMAAPIAAALLIAYLLLSSEIFLATYALGRFEMSYLYMGPTELRIVLCAGNLYLFLHRAVHPFSLPLSLFNFGGIAGAAGMLVIAIASAVRHGRELYQMERLP